MAIGLWGGLLGLAIFLFYFCLPDVFPKIYKNQRVWDILLYVLIPLFWIFLISDLYLSRGIADLSVSGRIFRLSDNVFWVWENLPVSQHHWLVFFDKNDLSTAYSGGGVFGYLFLYASAKAMAWITNSSLAKAQFMLAYLYAVLQAWTVIFSIQKLTGNNILERRQRFSYFFAVSFFFLLPGTWNTIFNLNQDHLFPLVGMYAFFWAVSFYKEAYFEKGWFVGLLMLGAIVPTAAVLFCMLTIGYMYFSDNIPSKTKKKVYSRVLIALIISLVCVLAAKLLLKYFGIHDSGSTFWFRSGLDGDTTYFQNIIDSVVSPIRGMTRMYSEFFPMVVCIFLAYMVGKKGGGEYWQRLLIISTSYYLLQLALFPQAIKIHPYLYDATLTIPVLGVSFYIFLRTSFIGALSASGFVSYNILMLGLVLSNLIIIARVSHGPSF